MLNNDQENDPFVIEIPLERIEIGKLAILNNIFFNSNEFNLLPESEIELKQLLLFLKENPKVSIEIGGHTDHIGDDESNLILSTNRAKTVFDYLIKNNIPANKLSFKGYGESRPLSNENTENGQKMNRRTEFKITNK
jgi:outer membrane protein OmpA-like peptidoglycan-associated protein